MTTGTPDDERDWADGWALWQELRPQSGEDWVKVAERFVAAGDTTEKSSPLFAALVQAVRERDKARAETTKVVTCAYCKGDGASPVYTDRSGVCKACKGAGVQRV